MFLPFESTYLVGIFIDSLISSRGSHLIIYFSSKNRLLNYSESFYHGLETVRSFHGKTNVVKVLRIFKRSSDELSTENYVREKLALKAQKSPDRWCTVKNVAD